MDPDVAAALDALLLALVRSGRRPLFLELLYPDGRVDRLSLPAPTPAPTGAPSPPLPARRAWHSPDFRDVEWGGRHYALSPMQALIVEQLWQAHEAGRPDVREADLLNGADSECERLVDLFRRSPAWRTLVVRGSGGDTYRLAELPTE